MQLDILPDGDVGLSACVPLCEVPDGTQLARVEDAVGDADAQHEMLGRSAFPGLAADGANAVTLCVNSPPLEVNTGPFGRNAAASLTGEFADFSNALPGILLALQTLDTLRLGLFRFVCC